MCDLRAKGVWVCPTNGSLPGHFEKSSIDN
jgi:hypothetical protein